MLIVIDLSRKLVGYKLFESFIYKFKNESNLVLANDPLTGYKLDYDELRKKVHDILYGSNTNSFSLCLLYDMNEQCNDPLKNSLINNVYNIEEKIIKPLSMEYTFNKLYYFSLDDVKKDLDGIPYDKNVKLAMDIDSLGYIKEEYDSKYNDILFTSKEIDNFDYIWDNIKNKDNTLENKVLELEEELNRVFSSKIDIINNGYQEYSWYGDRLNEVYRVVLNDFKTILYKKVYDINDMKKISEYIKDNLKNRVSSYRNRDIKFIHINLNKNISFNNEISKYRHQIEILAFIIYLATNDTKFIFKDEKYLGKENHFEIDTELKEENLIKMLKSFILKLKLELDELNKIDCSFLDYKEFKLGEFELSYNKKEKNKNKLLKWFGIGIFYNKSDIGNLSNYINYLYVRYVNGVKFANERLCDLTSTLRTKRDAMYTDSIEERIEISKLDLNIKMMKKKVCELEQEIALNQLKEINDNSDKIRKEYDNIQNDIEKIMKKRISFRRFIINSIFIIITSLCSYKLVSELILPGRVTYFLSIIILVLPIFIYSLVQYMNLLYIKVKIDKKVSMLVRENDNIVSELYSDDSKIVNFVKNTYKLIMMKKYINEYELKIKIANDKFKNIEYHKEKLKSIYDMTRRLIDVLGIDIDKIDVTGIDKINKLDINKNIYWNELYCPLNYLSKIDEIENKVIVNDEQIADNSNLIGFVNKFNITYDKGYRHE